MPVSAGIYNALNQPVRSVADYAADYDQADIRKQGMQRNALMMQEAQAAMADRQAARQMAGQRQNALQALMQQGGKPEDIETGMLANPLLMGDGQAMRESRLKAGELDAKNRSAQFELQQKQRQAHAQQAASYQSPDEAIAHLQQAVTSGEIPPVAAQAYEKLIRTDPQWQLKLVMGAMNPEKMAELLKPVLVADDIGGSRMYGARDPVSGALTRNASVAKTQTPDSVASNARMAADAAAGRAQSESQFGRRLAYDQGKDATAAAGGANITEGERNAGGYASRMVEASKLLDQFEGKGRATYKTDALGGVPLVGRALQTSAMTSEQQRYRQAQEDWVRAKLRKESGASIAPDEMAREISAYFPEPGDLPENIAQKKQAREVANTAMVQSAGRGAPKPQKTITVDW